MRFRRRLKYPCIRARGSCIRRMAVSMQNTIKKTETKNYNNNNKLNVQK